MTQRTPFDIFLTKNYAKEAQQTSREGQIFYLKKHEAEWTDAIKEQYPKITSVQYDWNSVQVGEIGNGLPQGGGWTLELSGKFNDIKDSHLLLRFILKNESSLPKDSYYIDDVSVLKNGGWIDYE
ncbi:MAG: hypothetical protein LBI13_07710 [Streptococcaceae bacterium]|nr:hypothetical protein [Streptococcaceae bacterium]